MIRSTPSGGHRSLHGSRVAATFEAHGEGEALGDLVRDRLNEEELHRLPAARDEFEKADLR